MHFKLNCRTESKEATPVEQLRKVTETTILVAG